MRRNKSGGRYRTRLKQTLLPLVDRLLSELPHDEIGCLLSPKKHMALLTTRRATMMISRVRLVAALFAILTPLWIVVDMVVFVWPLSTLLALGRIVVSIAFATLALSYRRSKRMLDAYIALAAMFAIPTLFFVYSQHLISLYHLAGLAVAVSAGYAFLPFIMAVGLSVFPLTVVEGVAFAAPVLLVDLYAELARINEIGNSAFLGTFWLLLLIATVAILAGMSQLGFMIAMVRQSIRDPLTGCFSRSSGEELLDIQFILSVRSQSPLSLAFIDIDNFKAVNDNYGHEAGDRVLASVAENIRHTLRTGDMLVRWGGEEFIIIFPNAYCTDALEGIERLRANGLGARPDGCPVTASIGLAERTLEGTEDWRRLAEIADRRMYLAKHGGKNRVVWEETAAGSPPAALGA